MAIIEEEDEIKYNRPNMRNAASFKATYELFLRLNPSLFCTILAKFIIFSIQLYTLFQPYQVFLRSVFTIPPVMQRCSLQSISLIYSTVPIQIVVLIPITSCILCDSPH